MSHTGSCGAPALPPHATPPPPHAMDHATTTDLAALEAEIHAMEAAHAVTDARLDALLQRWEPRPTTGQRIAALWQGVEQLQRWNDQDEAEIDALRAEIDAMEQNA